MQLAQCRRPKRPQKDGPGGDLFGQNQGEVVQVQARKLLSELQGYPLCSTTLGRLAFRQATTAPSLEQDFGFVGQQGISSMPPSQRFESRIQVYDGTRRLPLFERFHPSIAWSWY